MDHDVKPANILFADSHTARIVDFGLAAFAQAKGGVVGAIWDTSYYVAPERLNIEPEDFCSDATRPLAEIAATTTSQYRALVSMIVPAETRTAR